MRKKTIEEQKKEAENNLIENHKHWKDVYENGGSDPMNPDGCNLNLIRNHILYEKKRLEELDFYPDAYYMEVPEIVPRTYMAKVDEIRKKAVEMVERVEQDPNYKYIKKHYHSLSSDDIEKMNLRFAYKYPIWLRESIDENDLVTMKRRGMNGEWIFDVLKKNRKCLEETLRKAKTEERQLTLFDFCS